MHVPVLLAEVVALLEPRPDGRYVDCTVGLGGHAAAILEASSPDGRLLGLDADAEAITIAGQSLARFDHRVRLVHSSFAELASVADRTGFERVDGVLFDLGVSSMQLDTPERGFSFQHDAPLDMRMDRSHGLTAADLVRDLDQAALADLIFRHGEEPRARQIARAIVSERGTRPIETTGQLAALVKRVTPGGRTHPATRTFQALRIAVNRELEVLEDALRQAHGLLVDGGHLVVISFHSLEDRIVKRYFASQASPCTCPPALPICVCGRTPTLSQSTRRAITPSPREVGQNPRSRSARLRAATRLASPI